MTVSFLKRKQHQTLEKNIDINHIPTQVKVLNHTTGKFKTLQETFTSINVCFQLDNRTPNASTSNAIDVGEDEQSEEGRLKWNNS